MDKRSVRKSLRTNFNPGPRDYLNRVLLRLRQAAHLPALLAGGRLDRPIFVIGAPRSGTSMLYAILRASPSLAHWPGEAHEVWEADFHPALHGWESNALDASDATGPEADRIKRAFYLVTGSRRRLIDKTPRNALRVSLVDALFPDARFVYLQRDGRDNVSSLINAWRTPRYRTYQVPGGISVPGVDPQWWKFTLYPGWREDRGGPLEVICGRQWTLSNDAALDDLQAVDSDRWTTVRYEELAGDPVAVTKAVMAWLQLDLDPAVSAAAQDARTNPVNVVTPPEAGKWRRENPAEIDNVMPALAPTLRRLGYEV
jgi:hypothetical protein